MKPTKRLLGQILLEGGFITRRDLKRALAEQRRTGELIGAILVRAGAIKSEELEFVLPIQRDLASLDGAIGLYKSDRLDIGRMLVSAGRVSETQLKRALQKQRKTKKDIGKILVEEGVIDRKHLSFVQSLQKKTLTAIMTAVFSLASVMAGETASMRAQDIDAGSGAVGVTATVMGRAAIKVISQTDELVITDADAERGYVEVSLGSIIEVRTNSRAGYALIFGPVKAPFRAIELDGLQRNIEISENGGWVVEPYPGKGPHTLEISYKFILADNAEPGTYAWPVRMSVRPM